MSDIQVSGTLIDRCSACTDYVEADDKIDAWVETTGGAVQPFFGKRPYSLCTTHLLAEEENLKENVRSRISEICEVFKDNTVYLEQKLTQTCLDNIKSPFEFDQEISFIAALVGVDLSTADGYDAKFSWADYDLTDAVHARSSVAGTQNKAKVLDPEKGWDEFVDLYQSTRELATWPTVKGLGRAVRVMASQ